MVTAFSLNGLNCHAQSVPMDGVYTVSITAVCSVPSLKETQTERFSRKVVIYSEIEKYKNLGLYGSSWKTITPLTLRMVKKRDMASPATIFNFKTKLLAANSGNSGSEPAGLDGDAQRLPNFGFLPAEWTNPADPRDSLLFRLLEDKNEGALPGSGGWKLSKNSYSATTKSFQWKEAFVGLINIWDESFSLYDEQNSSLPAANAVAASAMVEYKLTWVAPLPKNLVPNDL